MKKYVALLSFGILIWTFTGRALANSDSFKPNQKIARIWAQIPFIQAGDLGQYQDTMKQGREGTRYLLWQELMSEVQSLAEKGIPAEYVIEPMAKILLDFNDVYDVSKARDSVRVDLSLESQFKGHFDNLFREWDVRETQRRVQLTEGSLREAIDESIRQLPSKNRKAAAQNIYSMLDYMAYGTFSSLGEGQFLLTLHLTSLKSSAQRSFTSQGRLTEAVGDLAQQLFDYFQKNEYAPWTNPYKSLTWLPMPVNAGKQQYSFAEARQYCQQRGYRLPYARELIMAASGTQYQVGGISSLRSFVNYAVLDLRETRGAHWLTMGHETATGGPISAFESSMGSFWCVKGAASKQVLFVEDLWALIRKYKMNNHEVFRALETIRLEIADFGAKEKFFAGTTYLEIYSSIEEAQSVLKKNGITLAIPKDLLR